jgi:hypothetical protein
MGAQAEADVLGTELERVLPTVPVLFDREGPFYASIEKKDVEIISNRQMRGPLEIRSGGKFGFFNPDGGDMGRGSGPKFDKFVLTAQHTKYAYEYTILSQWVTDDKRKAVINNIQRAFASALKEYRRQCDAMAVGSGDGVVGTILTATSQTDFTLDNSFGVKLLRYDQDISVYDTTLATKRVGGEQTINLLDLQNKRITVAGAFTGVVATDKIVVSGLTATPPVGIKGVMYHHSNASTGTWLGFDRSLTPEIRANRVNGNSSALTLPLPRLALNKAADRVGLENIGNYAAWMHPCQAQAYEELGFLVTQINQTGEGKSLDLYFGGAMTMAGAPVKKSFNWNTQRIDFVNMDYWGRGELHPASFYEPVPGKRVYELRGASGGLAASCIFYLTGSFDLFVTNPAGCSYIDSLAVPAGY